MPPRPSIEPTPPSSSRHPAARPLTLAELHGLAVSKGAVDRFFEVIGGPPDLERCSAEDVIAFIRKSAP